MTSNEHYRQAAQILAQVEQAEREAEAVDEVSVDALQVWNSNVMRKLKIAEVHLLAALVQRSY